MSSRPIRKIQPTAKLTSKNAGDLILTSHCRAIVASHATALPPLSLVSECPGSSTPDSASSLSPDPSPRTLAKRAPAPALVSGESSEIDNDTNTTDVQENSHKAKKLKTTLAPGQSAMRPQNDLLIIEINDTDDLRTEQLNKTDASADIKEFFSPVPHVPGQEKVRMLCKLCEYMGYFFLLSFYYLTAFHSQGIGCPKQEKVLISEHTTLRRHAASVHVVRFMSIILQLLSHICLSASLQEMVYFKQLRLNAA